MNDPNTIRDLQNYIVGPGAAGLVLASDGSVDFARSFRRIDYLAVLPTLSVRNNVQAEVGPRPVDFIALRIPGELLPPKAETKEDAVWLYGDEA
jgi:hypothetical protein